MAIGTVHGPYKGEPKLDLERLEKIRSLVSIPLVLHGGSGLSDQDFRKEISAGISKINFFTEASLEAVGRVRMLLDRGIPLGYPDLTQAAEERIREIIQHQMVVFGTQPLR